MPPLIDEKIRENLESIVQKITALNDNITRIENLEKRVAELEGKVWSE